MTVTKHQPWPLGPSFGSGIEKRSGSSMGRRLLSLKSIELPKRKQSYVRNYCSIQAAPKHVLQTFRARSGIWEAT
jgi:hypothetical protein